jgi:GNAT superfamily N-acetyltransferase
MEIRERRDIDLDQLVTVARRVHEADRYPIFLPDDDFYGFLTRPKPAAAWVAVHHGSVVGHVALNVETSRPVMQLVAALDSKRPAVYVARLLVDPGARRAGIGRKLLEHARRAAVVSGHVPVLDVVDTPTAAAAISLYRSDGWDEVGRVSFDPVDAEMHELVFRGPSA